MDYTKFIRAQNNSHRYRLRIRNEYVKNSMEKLADIAKAKNIITNYSSVDYQISIDEYFAYFLKDKNEFISDFSSYITKDKEISKVDQIVYNSILNVLKRNLDDVLTNFKLLKQRMYRKLKQKERFNQSKLSFLKNIPDTNIPISSLVQKKENVKNEKTFMQSLETSVEDLNNKYKEPSNVVHIFMNSANKSYEKTKQILFELSDLMTTVQTKIFEQSEMTKTILFNSEVSVTNIEEGNKQLKIAQEYQKGRGIMYGAIFIILGLFLVLYDYTI